MSTPRQKRRWFHRLGAWPLVVGLLSIVSFEAPGATLQTDPSSWTLRVDYENDLFFSGRDEDYTSGLRVAWISPQISEAEGTGSLPGRLYRLFDWMPLVNKPSDRRNVAIAVGHNLYTPGDLEEEGLIEHDRPYAGWAYLSLALHNKKGARLDTLEMSLGVVGPWALGEELQNFVHRYRKDAPEARGWDNQIKNEPAINFIGERKIRHDLIGREEGWRADIIGHLGGSLGNVFTYANTGAAIRAGWNLPADFGASVIRLAGDTNAPAPREIARMSQAAYWGIHGFGGFDARLVLRDITLDGNTFRTSHSVDRRPLVADVYAGIGIVAGRWKASYAQTLRTRTFEGGRHQVFGSVSLARTF